MARQHLTPLSLFTLLTLFLSVVCSTGLDSLLGGANIGDVSIIDVPASDYFVTSFVLALVVQAFRTRLRGFPLLMAAAGSALAATGIAELGEQGANFLLRDAREYLQENQENKVPDDAQPEPSPTKSSSLEKRYQEHVARIVKEHAANGDSGLERLMDYLVGIVKEQTKVGGILGPDRPVPTWWTPLVKSVQEFTVANADQPLEYPLNEFEEELPSHLLESIHAQIGSSWDTLS